MGEVWDADVEVGEARSKALIEAQFPELGALALESLGVGWDNVAWLVNGEWVFRLPRRQIAAGLLENEAHFLPLLAPHLPQAIPLPEYLGRAEGDYPLDV